MATDRRARFRDYMRRLDPTASPDRAMGQGFYVVPPGAVASRIGARLDIEPTSSHLLMGGIGCGKTTELLAIRSLLLDIPDVGVAMVDVLARQRETKLEPGVLLVLAGLELIDWIAERSVQVDPVILGLARRAIEGVAHGRVEHHEDYEGDPQLEDYEHWVPGVLEEPITRPSLEEVAEQIHALIAAAGISFTILFDGLDRLPDASAFLLLIRADVPLLKLASIGVVIVGPQRLRFEADRSPQEIFSEVHLHGAVDHLRSDGQAFLHSVLRARVGADILPDEACGRLASWSGGVLRDLIALARSSGETAYSLGHDNVTASDIEIAADRFGRGLVLGMTTDMLERLSQLTKNRLAAVLPRPEIGVIATDADVSLLLHRVLIEVPATPVQYRVHPTIVPLLRHLQRRTA